MAEIDIEKEKEKKKIRIKKYLELENVSFLTGAGTSFHMGAPIIRSIPEGLKKDINDNYDHEDICKFLGEETFEIPTFERWVRHYYGENKDVSYEEFINCLQADRFLIKRQNKNTECIDQLIHLMQNWLFKNCDTEKTVFKFNNDDEKNKLDENRYYYHESFIKKILQRPNNLKRANLFTTNYDMAFDYALDNLGVHYINGFMGVHNRCFRPEVYDYDLYYPGQSVTGKVHRAEKVIKYYKIHGSLSWFSTKSSRSNTYGIQELTLHDDFKLGEDKELMIYPCVSKKSFTLDLPYSELFRQFAQAIHQPQSVLFCVGYSFNDEHINDIIFQALSIPSFTLIIANYTEKKEELPDVKEKTVIQKLHDLNDSRIIILEESDMKQSTFIGFVSNMLPDLYEENEKKEIADTLNVLFKQKDTENEH